MSPSGHEAVMRQTLGSRWIELTGFSISTSCKFHDMHGKDTGRKCQRIMSRENGVAFQILKYLKLLSEFGFGTVYVRDSFEPSGFT